MSNNVLIHYGILGMKWGRRKSQSTSSTNHKSGEAKRSNKVKNMSDAELRARVNRLQLEKQYRDLSKGDVSKGRKFVSEVMTNSAKKVATDYVSKYMTKGINYAINNVPKKK